MPTFEKLLPNPYNYDKLYQDIQAQYPAAVMTLREFRLEVSHDNADSGVLDSLIAAHNPATLTTEQTKAIARTLLLSDAKNYLSNQLQSASPNVTDIFTTVRSYVAGNATLTQMVSNQIALFNTAYAVTVNPSGATAADRARYLICCQLVLATIA